MPELVTLDKAKKHLGVTTDDQDELIGDKLEDAIGIVVDYLTRRDTVWNAAMSAWTPDTVPGAVRAAVLITLAELHRFRGDDAEAIPRTDVGPSRVVRSLLAPYHDPGMA
jgi:hypothetical protein